MSSQPVRVFISYSWGEGQEYKLWVRQLAARLRQDGVDAMCDAWKPEGSTIPEFMNREVRRADKVLVLCSPTFRTKVHQTEDGIQQTGAGWESGLITSQIFSGIKDFRAKVLAVLTKGEWTNSAPDFMLGFDWLNLSNPETFESDYSRLLRRLTVGEDQPPPLGALPAGLDPIPVEPLRGRPAAARQDVAVGHTFDGFSRTLATEVFPSRWPIVIAVEEADHELDEADLLLVERHLTLTFTKEQVEALEKIASTAHTRRAIQEVVDDGIRVWDIAGGPRLKRLFTSVGGSTNPQPVAWTGRSELLIRIYKSLLMMASKAVSGPNAFLSVSAGDHYFNPVDERGSEWGMQRRTARKPMARAFVFEEQSVEEAQSNLNLAAGHEVALLSAPNATSRIGDLVEVIKRQRNSRTRVAVGFGESELSAQFLQQSLANVPCLSFGGSSIRQSDLIDCLADVLPELAVAQAIPCIISSFRREWLRTAWEANDSQRLLDGLFWSTWSRVGKPLFADDFGEVIAASYPHLTDLRSLASKEWYYNRRDGIAACYQANILATSDASAGNRFHLYLSGAGGTGKSCFLRFVYDQLVNRPDVLTVWYQVDAPSSVWENVETRVREEIELAAKQKLGNASHEILPVDAMPLSLFLGQLADNLRKTASDIREIVVFIDQLERTFESGDEPDIRRLQEISRDVVDLLKAVKVGKGVRLFIASRKQYLPDFLKSFHEAEECGLHFNVLQTINAETERIGFIERVLAWCKQQGLVDKSVTIDRSAATLISKHAYGHPLEMMLALIHIFSQGRTGPITEDVVEDLRPWEKLFDFDLKLARKDDLDWYFLLAMAHSRTEIVGFEEVWWRLHLVDPVLTRRVDLLEPPGVQEWLWLRGHLGRTIHARPEGTDRARYLEFFHANLRDHLLRDVMSRTGETPPAWRALDRLSAAAHGWDQILQLLDRDDVHSLMEHRQFTVEPTGRKDRTEREVFYLVFLRDHEKARLKLCTAAKECFVLSVLVYEESARWAFREVFPDIATQIACCDRWLKRSSSSAHRTQILQYLADHELPEARKFLTRLILEGKDSGHADRWTEVAQILAAPLNAATYRSEVVVTLVETIGERSGGRSLSIADLPERFRDFVIASCGANRDELLSLLSSCADRMRGLENPRIEAVGQELRSSAVVDSWLRELGGNVNVATAANTWGVDEAVQSKIQLIIGSALAPYVSVETAARWRATLSERLGVPIPPMSCSSGHGDAHELEVRLSGRRVAAETFFPPRSHVLLRHWEKTQTFTPPDVNTNDNEILQEVVLWLDPDHLRQANWELPMWTADEAMLYWLEVIIRRYFDQVFDYDLLNEFVREIDVRGIRLPSLREVIINLIHENVPVTNLWSELVAELQHFESSTNPDILTQNLREKLGPLICQRLADDYGQLSVIILDENLEKTLMGQVNPASTYQQLLLDPAQAYVLVSSIARHVERNLRENGIMPVVACERILRLPLLRLIEPINPRVLVLSYTELSPALRLVDAGMVAEKPETDVSLTPGNN